MRKLFPLAVFLALGCSPIHALATILATHTTSADFALGSTDGQVERTGTGGGAVQLAKKAGALGAWSGGGTSLSTSYDGGAGLQQSACFATDNALYVVSGLWWNGSTEALRSEILRSPLDVSGNAGAWSSIATVPVPAAMMAIARWGNRIYFGGGLNGSGRTELKSMTIDSSGGLGAITTETSLPTPASWVPRLYALKGRLYLLNDQSTAMSSAPINGDGSVGTWVVETGVTCPHLPVNIFSSFLGDRLLIFGWESGADADQVFIGDGVSSAAGSWQVLNSLPAARRGYDVAGAGAGGKFYQVGGHPVGSQSATSAIYSADALVSGVVTWATEAVSLPANRANEAPLFAKGNAYYIGGWNGAGYTANILKASLNQGTGNAAVGSFIGRFNLGSVQSVDHMEWDANYPAFVKSQVRTAGSNGIFGAWTALSAGAVALNAAVQYVDYRLELSDPGAGNTLEVSEVRLSDVPATPSQTPALTPSITPTVTPTPTVTIFGFSPISSATPTITPTPSPSPILNSAGRPGAFAPVPAHVGQRVYFYKADGPNWRDWTLFTAIGSRAAVVADDLDKACIETQHLSPGIYWAVSHDSGWMQKIVVLP